MSKLVRLIVVLVSSFALLGIGALLSDWTGIELGFAQLIVVAVFAAIAIPATRRRRLNP